MSWYEDNWAFPESEQVPAVTKLATKIRYRSASMGVPLTPNEIRVRSWKHRYKGKRAFLIGNGPSLKKQDLRPLKDEITFGVNAIYLNAEEMGFLPTHYIVEDTFVAEDRAKEIVDLDGPTKWIGHYLKYCLGQSHANWLNVFVDYRNYPGFPHFSMDVVRGIWVGGTVSYLGMQLAHFMGVQHLYLVGFDHSYSIPSTGVIKGNEILSTGDDPNHFHSDYFGKGYRWHDPKVERMALAYKRAGHVYKKDGREIFNATEGGKLDVFPRVELATLFRNRDSV